MPLVTRELTITIKDAQLQPIVGAECYVSLSFTDAEADTGTIAGGAVINPVDDTEIFLTDAQGQARINLFPNALAQGGSYYELTSYHPETQEVIHRRVPFQMPDANADFEDIAPITPSNPPVGTGGTGQGGSGENNPSQVSGAEITAGILTSLRSYSPADIVSFVSQHVNDHLDLSSYSTAAEVTAEIAQAVGAAITDLIDSAPGALDTLNELSAALGQDPNFAATISGQLATITADVAANTAHAALAHAPDDAEANPPIATAQEIADGNGTEARLLTVSQVVALIQNFGGSHAPVTTSGSDPT